MSEDLIERLRGTYRIPITDGMGPAGGEDPDNPNEFVRTFDTPPIQKEAAAEIERLRAKLAEAESGMLRADFNDCNAERARWKQRAEAAELELTAANKERDNWRQAANHWLDEAMDKRFEKEAAEMRLASAKEVIAPFAECGRSHTDEHGWIDGFGNERLCNWIGPSDLRAAAEWMEKGDE